MLLLFLKLLSFIVLTNVFQQIRNEHPEFDLFSDEQIRNYLADAPAYDFGKFELRF